MTEVGSRPECRAYHHIPNKDGKIETKKILEPFGKSKRTIAREDDNGYALISNHNFNDKNPSVLDSVTLTVNSPHLLKAFREVVKSYSMVASDFEKPFELKSPFQMLIHYWAELESHLAETDDALMRMHLNLLLQFMRHELGSERERLDAMISSGHITFETAWVLFRPGDLVYCELMGHEWVLRCHKTAYEANKAYGPYMEVQCTFTDHDGEKTGRASHTLLLIQKRHFGSGHPAKITSLPVYPHKFVVGRDLLDERLEKRGHKFLALRDMSVRAYNGLAQYLKEPGWDFWHWDMESFSQVWLPYTVSARSYIIIPV